MRNIRKHIKHKFNYIKKKLKNLDHQKMIFKTNKKGKQKKKKSTSNIMDYRKKEIEKFSLQ
jgi:hypothetical protein